MGTKCYVELRKTKARSGTESLSADLMRHLHTRQHLGKVVVICEAPSALLGAARKQWLKLSRMLQKQRASTVNADKILKYTHSITRMQHMQFSSKSPLENPEADVYFLEPASLVALPVHCWSVYLTTHIPKDTAKRLPEQLPAEALIIDYDGSVSWPVIGVQTKKLLDARVASEWRQVAQFLQEYQIDPTKLIIDGIHNVEAMDDALDTLLGMSHRFLEVANEFQRVLELARPLRLTKETRAAYDSLVLLAHRVQALTPGTFTQRFLETYNEDDTFFLYDKTKDRLAHSGETLAEAFHRHTKAGRHHLAQALQTISS